MQNNESGQDTKKYIIETAMRLFQEKGLENINIEDIVKKVGVTRGAFYHYFKSREELIASVMYKSFHENNPFMIVEKRKDLNALEKMHCIIKQILEPHIHQNASTTEEIKKLANNPVVFKNEVIFQVNVISMQIEKLILYGNEDGSTNVTFPKQASQTIALLAGLWLSPYIFETSYEEYEEKVIFYKQLGELLGVAFVNEEIEQLYLELGKREFKK